MAERQPPAGIASHDWSNTPENVRTLVYTLLTVVEELQQTIAPLQGQIKQLQGRIAQLEEQVQQTWRNSSKPPSSDPPGLKKPPAKQQGQRRQGGQPGHVGQGRKLKPPEEVTRFVLCQPTRCQRCDTLLLGQDPQPQRHQVCELPLPEPEIIEYQLHTLTCLHCDHPNCGQWPLGMPPGSFGPRVQGLLGYLSGRFGLGRRDVVEIMPAVFQVDISLGAVSAQEALVSQALSEPVDECRAYVQQQNHVNTDETSWRKQRQKHWLWTATTPLVTVFLLVATRGAAGAKELLGQTFSGITGSDRWSGYHWLDASQRQLCWAHLVRDFQAFVDRKGESATIGQRLLQETASLFDLWHQVRDSTLSQTDFQTAMQPIRRDIVVLLQLGTFVDHTKTAKTCANILAWEPALWSFVTQEGVEPTNNAAERALRRGVLWRKRSFGSQNDRGLRFTERILTTVTTLRQQRRNVLAYLTAACQAQNLGLPAPSLLPVSCDVDLSYTN